MWVFSGKFFFSTVVVLTVTSTCIENVWSVENVRIKIADAPAVSHIPSFHSSSKQLSLRADPSPLSGPVHLKQLNGECFRGKEKGYEYIVCPFQNVTQKEEKTSWNSFHGVLGVWNGWIVENDTLTGMHFTMGERCGSLDREAKVMLNCSTLTKLHTMSEPSTCSYTIWLDTPLACFEGAMQVYHLLSDDQLKSWNLFDEEYYRDEITFQGLTKQRQKLLLEAGLLRPPKEVVKPTHKAISHPMPDALSDCRKEKEKLEKTIGELQTKIDEVVKSHPAIASILLGFVSESINQSVADVGQQRSYAHSVLAVPKSAPGMNATQSEEGKHTSTESVTAANFNSTVT